jgi:hypothetical protein
VFNEDILLEMVFKSSINKEIAEKFLNNAAISD